MIKRLNDVYFVIFSTGCIGNGFVSPADSYVSWAPLLYYTSYLDDTGYV